MSSKSAAESDAGSAPRGRRPASIALRLAIWYAVSAFALIFLATGALYWALASSLYREDAADLQDELGGVRLLLESAPPGEALRLGVPGQASRVYIRVLGADGRTLEEAPGMTAELPVPSGAELAAIRGPQGETRQVLSRSGRPFLVVTAPARAGDPATRFLQVAVDRSHDAAVLARYRERLWAVLSVALALCSAAGYLITRRGMRPIEQIGRSAARVRSATLHERIATAGLPAELLGLAETFNDMLERLETAFRHIAQFSDDVAHELRTPINNLRGEIEVALGRARSGADYRATLASCLEECARISRLIQSLLFLARTENAGEALQLETVDVGRELATVREFYEAAAAEAGIELAMSVAGGLRAPLDRTLFQQAVGNLVSNAIAHTAHGGSVTIAAAAADGQLNVSVRDTGCGIASEHLPHVFERFYRVDPAGADAAQHVGLGLAMVKSIAARHGGGVGIESEPGSGTEVRLVLPAGT